MTVSALIFPFLLYLLPFAEVPVLFFILALIRLLFVIVAPFALRLTRLLLLQVTSPVRS